MLLHIYYLDSCLSYHFFLQATIDPAMLSEIEGLRNHQMTLESEKMGLESECGSLHGRLNSKPEEYQQIQQALGKKNFKKSFFCLKYV